MERKEKRNVDEYMVMFDSEKEYTVVKKVFVQQLLKKIEPQKDEKLAIYNCLNMLHEMYSSCYTIGHNNERIFLCDENVEVNFFVKGVIRSMGLLDEEG